ncbi:hypothetical protein CF326_g8195, partial [Tilletia indica]
MFTFLKFTPFDSSYAPFSFVLHPHLRRPNLIDDTLLKLDYFQDDEASITLFDGAPVISATRFDLGIYLNHQLLSKAFNPFRDGDVLAFPRHPHDLKTAVRFRVELVSMQLCQDMDVELDVAKLVLQEKRDALEDASAISNISPPTPPPPSNLTPPACKPYGAILDALRSRACATDDDVALGSLSAGVDSNASATVFTSEIPSGTIVASVPTPSPPDTVSPPTSASSSTPQASTAVDRRLSPASPPSSSNVSHPEFDSSLGPFQGTSDEHPRESHNRMTPSSAPISAVNITGGPPYGSAQRLRSADIALQRVRSALLETVFEHLRRFID